MKLKINEWNQPFKGIPGQFLKGSILKRNNPKTIIFFLGANILEQHAAVLSGRINSPHHWHILQLGHSKEMSLRYLTPNVYVNPQSSDGRFLSRNSIPVSVSRQSLMYHFKLEANLFKMSTHLFYHLYNHQQFTFIQ